jgi:hypothetical protein
MNLNFNIGHANLALSIFLYNLIFGCKTTKFRIQVSFLEFRSPHPSPGQPLLIFLLPFKVGLLCSNFGFKKYFSFSKTIHPKIGKLVGGHLHLITT